MLARRTIVRRRRPHGLTILEAGINSLETLFIVTVPVDGSCIRTPGLCLVLRVGTVCCFGAMSVYVLLL